MTTPVQSAASSPAAAAAASPASGAGTVIAKDTVTPGTSVTGLAGVLAVADAAEVADKIVQKISPHIQDNGQGRIQEIVIINDLSALTDITALRILRSQLTQLTGQISAYAKSFPDAKPSIEADHERTFTDFIAPFAGIGTVMSGLGAAAGLISQLVTGTYTYSGQVIPNASVGGLDILIAQRLAEKRVPVRVDRFAAMPADSEILAQIQDLVPQVTHRLNPALTRAAKAAADKAQIVANDKDRLARLDAQLAAAQKDPTSANGNQQKEYDEIISRLPGESGEAAVAQNLVTSGQALAAAVSAFVTATMSAPAAGGLAPVARAAHGEALGEDGTAILYAQVIAAGDDQVLRQTLIHNTWSNLTGVTAEYALLMPGGEAAASGLASAFAITNGSIRKGLSDIARKPLPLRLG